MYSFFFFNYNAFPLLTLLTMRIPGYEYPLSQALKCLILIGFYYHFPTIVLMVRHIKEMEKTVLCG